MDTYLHNTDIFNGADESCCDSITSLEESLDIIISEETNSCNPIVTISELEEYIAISDKEQTNDNF